MDVFEEVKEELAHQDSKWGEQNHPSGTGRDETYLEDLPYWENALTLSNVLRDRTQYLAEHHEVTWLDILFEEVAEAFAEYDEKILRGELVQIAGVALQWVKCIDRRAADK